MSTRSVSRKSKEHMTVSHRRAAPTWLHGLGAFAHMASLGLGAFGLALLEEGLLQNKPAPSAECLRILACAVALWITAQKSGSVLVPTGSIWSDVCRQLHSRREGTGRL